VKKSKLYGLIGSTLSTSILFLVLWFVVLSVPSSTENEGFLVSFGDSFDAGGSGEVATASAQTTTRSTENLVKIKETATESKPSNQNIFTQNENSVSIAEQKEKERVSKEQEAIRVQQFETNKRIGEQKRKEQIAINRANAVNGLFGNNGSGGGTGSGNGTGTGKGTGSGSGNGIQGNPAGKGNSGVGFTLNLGTRNYYGDPVKPNYPKDIEGKITVNIRVDESGNVTSASIGSPTTISESEMRKDAMSAANKTRFTSGKRIETGYITYNYKLQ
jgi:TonB family protein